MLPQEQMFSKVMPYRMGQSFACSMFAPANGSTVISTSHQFLAILRWVVFSTAGCVIFHASIICLFQVSQTLGTHNGYLFCYSQKVLCLLRSLRDVDGFFFGLSGKTSLVLSSLPRWSVSGGNQSMGVI